MRLFFAVCFPPDVIGWLCGIQDALRPYALRGNFTRKENLHLTLHFLGELPGSQVGALTRVAEDIHCTAFTLTLAKTGFFRRPGGDILWAGIQPCPALNALHKELGERLKKAGFTVEERPYMPHLTLAREIVLHEGSPTHPAGQIETQVNSFVLMKSERIGGVLRYTPLHENMLL